MEVNRTIWHVIVAPREVNLDVHGRKVRGDLHQAGFTNVTAVQTSRVYRMLGSLTREAVRHVADALLADPVVETYSFGPGLGDVRGESKLVDVDDRSEHDGASLGHAMPPIRSDTGISTEPNHGYASRGPCYPQGLSEVEGGTAMVEVQARPGVMDPPALSALQAIRRLLNAAPWSTAPRNAASRVDEVSIAHRYTIYGTQTATDQRAAELGLMAQKVLANDCIESWTIHTSQRNDPLHNPFVLPPERDFALQSVAMSGLDDQQLLRLSREGHLFLSLQEMRAIRDYYTLFGREPTDLELETLAQTWSEHCVHKTLKSVIEYEGENFGKPGHIITRFNNLLKETIVAATNTLRRAWCLSVFVDNAGVIAFDNDFGIAFKVETHNHPSAIEPYGGAATGVGGCIRDIMGCGLGAKPIASTDVFCLAPPDYDNKRLPKDVLHPRRVLHGVVGGVRDYGNRMGIPTVNGAIYFDDKFLANPLVFCGCVGLIPRDRITKSPRSGDWIVVVGGRTGRDGIHGATFSSAELTDTHADEFSHAVQIGNPVEEKKVLDALLLARNHTDGCLYSAVTDCGAGGLSSAVGEMGAKIGAAVDLEKVPLKYPGLRYDEIWISEAQERMVFSVPPERLERFMKVFAGEEVEATVIGTFTDDKKLIVRYHGEVVGVLDMDFLHDGLPRSTRIAKWLPSHTPKHKGGAADRPVPVALYNVRNSNKTEPQALACTDNGHHVSSRKLFSSGRLIQSDNANEQLLAALSNLNVASKEWVIRQYDHEVQGRSVIKPLVGPAYGPSDAAVLRPRLEGYRGIALACGLCPELSEHDPYWMAIAAVDEALRNVICVGADPQRVAILDNFCWPKVDTPESLGALVRTCKGASDAAVAYGLPFISGKDSLNNEFAMSEEESRRVKLSPQLAIPYTLLISAVGVVEDVRCCIATDLKQPNNCLVLAGSPVDRTGLQEANELHVKAAALIRSGQVLSAHDVSDGGLAVAMAEMCIASGLGVEASWNREAYDDSIFALRPTTYILEMNHKNALASRFPIIGRVMDVPRIRIDVTGENVIDLLVEQASAAWRSPLSQGGTADD